MTILDNGYNVYNHSTDTNYTYSGAIGIEQRGSSSQFWWYPQKSYNFETRDISGNDNNVSILGMPAESDWVLYSPYDDRTLMRNVITYALARDMGYWAPRTKFCELLLNDFLFWNYRGIYVMMEKIKRDQNRVDIAKLDSNDIVGDQLTGGYIIAVDSNIVMPDQGFSSLSQPDLFYSFKYPKGDDITPQQETYIRQYVDSFETIAASPNSADPVNGYRKFIVDTTFMDFFFFQELSKNADSYKRSAYLFKDKDSNGGKLKAGPLWDFNIAWNNIALCPAYNADTGWAITQSCWVNSGFPVPQWWGAFFRDSIFVNQLHCRWMHWRTAVLDTANIFHKLDSMKAYVLEGQVREYAQYGFTEDFSVQIDTLKSWITRRLTWMDANMPGNCLITDTEPKSNLENLISIYPNPANGEFTIGNLKTASYDLEIYDVMGQVILTQKANSSGVPVFLNAPPGIYFLKIKSGTFIYTSKFVNQK